MDVDVDKIAMLDESSLEKVFGYCAVKGFVEEEGNGEIPSWARSAEPLDSRLLRFANEHGELWYAWLDLDLFRLTGLDVGWVTRSVEGPDYVKLVEQLERAKKQPLTGFLGRLLGEIERELLITALRVPVVRAGWRRARSD